jgi:hypothetical protein
VRCSTAENTWLSALEICAAEDTCHSRCQQSTQTRKGIRVGLTEKHLNIKFLVPERDHGIVEPQVFYSVHKLRETWNGKRELLEESEVQVFEARGRDPKNNRFQVSANASEPEQAKVRKCNLCRDWRMCELPLHIMVGNKQGEVKVRASFQGACYV